MSISAKRRYSNELEKLQADPEHYMTPGARRYFTRVWLGYAVLACAMIAGVWGVTNKVDKTLRKNINTFIVISCKQSIPTLKKFNAAVDADIALQQDAKKLNLARGDTQRAALNDRTIKLKKNSKLHVPTIEECNSRGKAF